MPGSAYATRIDALLRGWRMAIEVKYERVITESWVNVVSGGRAGYLKFFLVCVVGYSSRWSIVEDKSKTLAHTQIDSQLTKLVGPRRESLSLTFLTY